MAEFRPALAHHFDDLEQQHESVTLGMWLFLVTEVMFFGGLFAAYAIYRTAYPEAWRAGSAQLDITLGAINTAILIGSSLTMALAVRSAQIGKRVGLIVNLVLTIVLGTAFLGIKAVEYTGKWHHHLVPGKFFQFDGPVADQVHLFYVFYFAMTGMHALHMIIGIGIMFILIWYALKGSYMKERYKPIEVTGLYWHFVDLVWIFLFPLLYLIGRH